MGIDEYSGASYIDFGAPNESLLNGVEPLWLPVQDNSYWWTAYVEGVYVGNDATTATKYALNRSLGLTDTGSSCIIGPQAEINAITDLLLASLSYYATDNSWGYLFWCDELPSMPNLNLLYGEYWFEVRPQDYGVIVGSSGG